MFERTLQFHFVVFLAMGVWSVSVAPAGASNDLAALETFSANTRSLQAEFEQVTRDVDGYVVDRSEGTFSFQTPNLLRWAYAQPFEEVIVGDGEQLWHHDPSLEQVTVRAQPEASESPILVLTDIDLMRELYRVSWSEAAERIELQPQGKDSELVMAWLIFADGKPQTVGWEDRFSQTTTIRFSSVEINAPLDDGLFIFSPPRGVEVLEGL